MVHFRLKQIPLVILFWSLFKYVKHTAPYFDSGSIFFKLYQEVMGRSKLYSVDYTLDEVRRLLLRSPPKTCPLDPLPADVLLESVDVLLPFITAMCNASLREGVLPASQKACGRGGHTPLVSPAAWHAARLDSHWMMPVCIGLRLRMRGSARVELEPLRRVLSVLAVG